MSLLLKRPKQNRTKEVRHVPATLPAVITKRTASARQRGEVEFLEEHRYNRAKRRDAVRRGAFGLMVLFGDRVDHRTGGGAGVGSFGIERPSRMGFFTPGAPGSGRAWLAAAPRKNADRFLRRFAYGTRSLCSVA